MASATRQVTVTWDTDGEEIADLDTVINVPEYLFDGDDDTVAQAVADYLSDETGWCVLAWSSADVTCRWFGLCENPATHNRNHPVLGDVPICGSCEARIS